ncbi:YdcF family protein [Citrobacter sp. FDAARGOS_156]|uniref:YdcF family protein n=1 Tax=Citrobacter sp. FDAARGOS_156 TaxID=1702170 RepID=UPI00190246B7|nr:YdcF family protein [Citrobacter sp. FDAARGOS_156]MBJ9113048.1 YdcF family protein [Citrobacter sp. FDAARGOS_156]
MKFQRIIALSFTIFTVVIAHNAFSIYQFSHEDQTRVADCAIVAGAGVNGDRPSPVFQARLDHAVWLYRQKFVSALVLTGSYSIGASDSDASIARLYVLTQGVPDNATFIEERSTVTRENIRYAQTIMKHQQWQTALLVSDPLHMLRLQTIARDNGINSWSSPTPSTRYQSWWLQTRFLLRESFYYSGYHLLRLIPVQNNSTIM